ncbi:hypothetical protein NDU88_005446 [Pleurodeles waltl]|uniref:Uncharacterized protein n=1 Tax=Pleurodeles waltl TaxID=8319 RepID=A0AAV7TVL9_PLEWA|nr:hypothetical protein NDU88_005446 [Pleurodeles waltl]
MHRFSFVQSHYFPYENGEEQHGVGVTALSQSRPPGEPKVRRSRWPWRSSRAGFAPGSARIFFPVVAPVGHKRLWRPWWSGQADGQKRTTDWGRTRPAFFSLPAPRFSCRGERRVQRLRRSRQSG